MVSLVFSRNISCLHSQDMIGARVLDPAKFREIVLATMPHVIEHTPPDEHGEWEIAAHESVLPLLSSGIGRNRSNLLDYVLRSRRGRVWSYLKREFALPAVKCTVRVITRERYLEEIAQDDSHALSPEELEGITHVIVGVRILADPNIEYPNATRSFTGWLPLVTVGNVAQESIPVSALAEAAVKADNYWYLYSEVAD